MESHCRRRSSIDRASVENILTSTTIENSHALPSTNPLVGFSPTKEQFAEFPSPRNLRGHARAMSYTPRRQTRLSLSFPVATARTSVESTRPTPTSSSTASFPQTPSDLSAVSPKDTNGFLVALASQERKVLDLKEQLQRAESDLKQMKMQWASHERSKKRAEVRHVEQLQPLNSAGVDEIKSSDGMDGATKRSLELDRRKSLLSNMPKDAKRKVFTGGHTRTLSLLSPERSNFTQPFPPVHESSPESAGTTASIKLPDTSQGISRITSTRAQHSYHGSVTHNAKQIAEDVKAGLWTFLEDLRQATVGDEAINGTTIRPPLDVASQTPKKKSSKGSLSSQDRNRRNKSPSIAPTNGVGLGLSNGDTANSSWRKDSHPTLTLPPPAKQKTSLSLVPVVDDDDDWSNWDTPTPKSPRWSDSTGFSEPEPATPSHSTGDHHALKIVDLASDALITPSKREEIQWPALDKLTPGNLKRTVSAIMQDWEKSLTPPPEARARSKSPKADRTTDQERSLSQLPLL